MVNAFIFLGNAFGLNGMGLQAVDLYRQMPNHLRDHISHVCVLNACSHAGLLSEARHIFNKISAKTSVIITTMVFFHPISLNLVDFMIVTRLQADCSS